MAVDLFEAVYARLIADPACAGLLTGGVHAGMAKPGTAMPYGVITEIGSPSQYTAGTGTVTEINDGSFQVAAFAIGRSAAVRCGEAVRAALHDAPLTFSGGHLSHLRQSNKFCSLDDSLGPGAANVWQDIREFRFIVSQEV